MAHATPQALGRIEPLLAEIRALGIATEKKRGIFYRGGTTFLHFHEFPDGLVADLKQHGDYVRYPVDTKVQQRKLLAAIRRSSVAVVKDARYTRASKPTGKPRS